MRVGGPERIERRQRLTRGRLGLRRSARLEERERVVHLQSGSHVRRVFPFQPLERRGRRFQGLHGFLAPPQAKEDRRAAFSDADLHQGGLRVRALQVGNRLVHPGQRVHVAPLQREDGAHVARDVDGAPVRFPEECGVTLIGLTEELLGFRMLALAVQIDP